MAGPPSSASSSARTTGARKSPGAGPSSAALPGRPGRGRRSFWPPGTLRRPPCRRAPAATAPAPGRSFAAGGCWRGAISTSTWARTCATWSRWRRRRTSRSSCPGTCARTSRSWRLGCGSAESVSGRCSTSLATMSCGPTVPGTRAAAGARPWRSLSRSWQSARVSACAPPPPSSRRVSPCARSFRGTRATLSASGCRTGASTTPRTGRRLTPSTQTTRSCRR
mmetsp:Transcript_48624/g.155317  ORF Transcript_48624/g.155317 Transcript_48624/m.155317 type:complete len:223 (+) Transcript_48624:144-812(+)